jgi:hypothetical protein
MSEGNSFDGPVCDAQPYGDFRACFNCEYKDDRDNCPIAREAFEKTIVPDRGPEVRFKGIIDIGTGEPFYLDDSKEEAEEKEEIIEAYRHPNCSWKKYTASDARRDLVDHSCLRHRYRAEPGDKPICKRVADWSRPYASCEACSKEFGLENPPCCY